jgi:8-oxo-dGTP pyrophosphatase MutT (NUDIX family)
MGKKVYAIVHDGKYVLLGSGGASGKPPEKRPGLHLPGGTLESKDPLDDALREIKQEMGITPATKGQVRSFATNDPDMKQVQFFVFKVESVQALVNNFKRPAITNPFDEPFEAVVAVSLGEAADHPGLNVHGRTDWFAMGIRHALDEGMLN